VPPPGWAEARLKQLTGGDQIRRFDGVQVAPPDSACTIAFPDFEDMPAMTLPFEMRHEGQVLVLFQAQFGGFTSSPDARAIIRFTIDGVVVGSAAALGNDHGSGLERSATTRSARSPGIARAEGRMAHVSARRDELRRRTLARPPSPVARSGRPSCRAGGRV
jgi:hypothetical protein